MVAAYLRAAVVQLTWRDRTRNLMELIFDCVSEALTASAIAIEEIDSVVISAHDLVDGRSLSSMVTAPAAGAYLRDETRLSDDGAAAVVIAAARVAAGQSENCLVAAWGRASEGDGQRISNALFDPFFARPLGMTELAVSALRASAALRVHAGYREHRAAVGAKRRAQGAGEGEGPWAVPAPLAAGECGSPRDLVAATVVTSESTDLRIAGTGMSSEPYWIGDRDLLSLPALGDAAGRALDGAARGLGEVDVFELDGPTAFDEALAAEAVGAAPRGEGMEALARDERLNPSGGYASGYCAPAMGLVRVVSAARLLRERGRSSVTPLLGLATGSSTVAAQTQFAVVLETRP